MNFTSFCNFLGIKLEPGQAEIARVAFDGEQPAGMLGERIFGGLEPVSKAARGVLVAVCGARGGKSYVLCALRLLHQALTVDIRRLAQGERAVGLIVAPDMRLARQTLRFAAGACRMRPELARCIMAESTENLLLKRPEGGQVSLECLPATRGGSALRGRSLVGAVLDESAFFRDESYQVNDVELFKAITPRILPGAQIVIASTPFTKTGLLYELFKANHGKHETAIAAHAPTLLLRDVEDTRAIVARERVQDPDNAKREYDAEFMDTGALQFFDSRAIERSVDEKLILPIKYNPQACTAIGADFAFRYDSSALVALERTPAKYSVADLLEMRPTESPLVPSQVVSAFARIARRYESEGVVADSHYRESIAEHLQDHRLLLFSAPEGATGKAETYQRTRQLLHAGELRLPPHERLIRQLREIQAKPTSGGNISIQSPRWRTGGHGDLVSALVLAVDYCAKHVFVPAERPFPAEGSPEFFQKQIDLRRERKQKAYRDREDWRAYLEDVGGDTWLE